MRWRQAGRHARYNADVNAAGTCGHHHTAWLEWSRGHKAREKGGTHTRVMVLDVYEKDAVLVGCLARM